jgi:rRNA-processing protein FCF1
MLYYLDSSAWARKRTVGEVKPSDTYGLRGADSVHLASALILKEELELEAQEFAFITSDRELKAAAAQAGLLVIHPHQRT